MEIKRGKLVKVEPNQTKQGKPYWTLHIDELKYNIFNPELINDVIVGDFVEFELKKNEKGYWNIAGNLRKTTPQTTLDSKTEPPKEFHLTAEAVRIGALDAAIKVTKKTGTEDYSGDLFSNFKQFERWILTGQDENN